MSMTQSTDAEADIHDEAELWFVRLLEPDCSAGERAAFERWLAASPDNAASYRAVERLWNLGEQAVQDPAVAAAAMRALQETAPPRRLAVRRFAPAFALAAAVVVAAVGLAPRWWPSSQPPAGTPYASAAGEQRTIALSDGSRIVLDTSSTLVERYSDVERRIDLSKGQAQFEVQGNPARPFVVHAQGGTVTAIGTAFQVRIDAAETTVTLIEGRLAVATNGDGDTRGTASLTAGQQVAYGRGGIGAVRTADLQSARGWTEGKLFVDAWRLDDLLTEMNRYTRPQLRVGDAKLRDIRISGVFRTGDQASLLLALKHNWAIDAKTVSPDEIVLTAH